MEGTQLAEIQAALTRGDKEAALRQIEQLKAVAVSMQPSHSRSEPQRSREPGLPPSSSQDVRITVNLEDRKNHGASLPLLVSPSMTFGQLKEHVAREWEIPVNVQRWLINNTQPSDTDRLRDYDIGGRRGRPQDEAGIILYILSLRSAAAIERQERRRVENKEKNARDAALAKERARIQEIHLQKKIERQPKLEIPKVGWKCEKCTFINEPTRPGCEQCTAARPMDYQVPQDYRLTMGELRRQEDFQRGNLLLTEILDKEKAEAEKQAKLNYEQIRVAYMKNVNVAQEEIQCAICFDTFPPGEAVVLRECLHKFCKECLAGQIEHCDDAVVTCPYNDEFSCAAVITEHEIKALVSPEIYQKYLRRGLQQAEHQEKNSYHCKTPDCPGWCVYEDEVNDFDCPICNKRNCLPCKAIHEGQNCKEYQDDIKRKAMNDEAARKTHEMLQQLIANKEAMECPGCKIIVQKKTGCDWMQCSMCKTEICWATLGARWGPKGRGDTSGGCRCRVNGQWCHPKCGNCH